jgi:hypothetical protein
MDTAPLKRAADAALNSARQVGAILDRNPVLALTAAVAVGFFAGLFFRRSQKSTKPAASDPSEK